MSWEIASVIVRTIVAGFGLANIARLFGFLLRKARPLPRVQSQWIGLALADILLAAVVALSSTIAPLDVPVISLYLAMAVLAAGFLAIMQRNSARRPTA